MMLMGSLMFDGLTASETDKQFKKSARKLAYPGMFANNLVGLILGMSFYLFSIMVYGDNSH